MNTPQPIDLGTLFFGAYRRQVLGLLLLHPEESFHLREIARATNTQPGTLRRELALLTEAGVLRRERVGNQVRYQADPACPIYEELRGILKKTVGVVDALRQALSPLADNILVAFVYGSLASGGERKSSDVDVMIVGAVSFEEVVAALHPYESQLRREINSNVYDPGEFKKKAKEKGSFLSHVLEAPKLFILGRENDLRQLAANRKGKST